MPIPVSCLLYDGFQMLDVAGAQSAFEICGYIGTPGYDLGYCTANNHAVTSSGGARLLGGPLTDAPSDATLLIPGGFGAYDPGNIAPFLPYVRAALLADRRIIAVGSGVRVLAMTGALGGRRVVAHWGPADKFAQDFPDVAVEAERLYLRDGNIWTSAGLCAGIDVALAIVEHDYGSAIARETARTLVLPLHRKGHGHQRSPFLELPSRGDRFSSLLTWAQERLDEPLPVERLAEQASLSVRQFTRAFTSTIGVPPAKAIEKLRVEAAESAIQAGLSLADAARLSGFGNGGRMRRAFIRHAGSAPSEIKRPTGIGHTRTTFMAR